jgi:putative ABC transport system permease protein
MKLLPLDHAVRSVLRAPVRSLGLFIGNVLVVLLVLAAAGFSEGMARSLGAGNPSPNVLLLGVGSEESIERSEIPIAVASLVEAGVSGIRQTGGVAHVSPEVVAALPLDGATSERAVVRGFTRSAFLVHPRVQIISGRPPRAGMNEVMVGQLSPLRASGEVRIDRETFAIVGVFSAAGSTLEGELWMPLQDLLVLTKRDTLSCVVVEPAATEFADFDLFAKMRPDLELSALRQADYDSALHAFLAPVRWMVWATALLMGLAGFMGGMNTLYAAFAARGREIGTLQAIGFSRRAVALGLALEALIVALAAGIVGCAIGLLFLHGRAVAFSMGTFQVSLHGWPVLAGLSAALLIGALGTILPVGKAMGKRIPDALKGA